jgi:hypothetical protein
MIQAPGVTKIVSVTFANLVRLKSDLEAGLLNKKLMLSSRVGSSMAYYKKMKLKYIILRVLGPDLPGAKICYIYNFLSK